MTFTVKLPAGTFYVDAEVDNDVDGCHAHIGNVRTMNHIPTESLKRRALMADLKSEIESKVDDLYLEAYMKHGITTELSLEELMTRYGK